MFSTNGLGSIITEYGHPTACIDETFKQIRAAFCRTNGAGSKSINVSRKLLFLESNVLAVARYRWSLWPFAQAVCTWLDNLQSYLLRICSFTEKNANEDDRAWNDRRAKMSGTACR